MPLYKGSSEVTSGNLHKGSTEIENGYKGSDSFYLNETTVSWALPTGGGFTYSTPSPQSSTGSPGSAFTSTTFTITAGSNALTGTATITGLPTGLTSSQSYNNTGPGNILTITIAGTFPTTSYLNTALTVSGLSGVTYYTLTVNYSGLTTPFAQQGTLSRSGSSGGNYINATNNGSTWTAQYAAGEIATANVSYSNQATGYNTPQIYEEYYFTGSYSGSLPTLTGAVTSWASSVAPPADVVSFGKASNNITMNGNKTVTMSGGYSQLLNSTWGYSIAATHSGAASTAIMINFSYLGGWERLQRTCQLYGNNGGVFLSYFTQSGGNQYKSYATGTILANTAPGNMQVLSSAGGYTNDYYFTWGGATLTTAVTFT